MSNLVPKFNKNDDLLIDRSDVALENFKPTSLLPIIELPNECHNISMGTDIEPECEVIAKPEEAGGTYLTYTLFNLRVYRFVHRQLSAERYRTT